MNPRVALRLLLSLGVVLLLGWLLWNVRILFAYFCAAAFISILGAPVVGFLGRFQIFGKKIPAAVRAGLTLLLLVSIAFGLMSVFTPMILEQSRIIAGLDVLRVSAALENEIQNVQTRLLQNGFISQPITMDTIIAEASSRFKFGGVADVFGGLLGTVTSMLVALFSVAFISFFFLKDSGMPARLVMMLTPLEHAEKVKRIEQNISRLLTRYVVGVVIQVTAVTLLVWLGLTIIGVKNALLIAFLAGLLNVIPYLGPLLGAVAGIFIALVAHLDAGDFESLTAIALKVAAVFAIMQLTDNFVFQPVIFSNSVSAHPLEIFAVIFIAGTLAGITGMLLAIPAYTVLRVVAKEFLSEYRWINRLTREI